MQTIVRALRTGFVLAVLLWSVGDVAGAQGRGRLYWVTVDQGLTAPGAAHVRRVLGEAEAARATALVVELRGGGSIGAAWPLARELYAAQVPVVVWIGPRGAEGGPVGTLLLAASDVAAMAPGATVGFAAPLVDVPAGFSDTTQQLVVDDAVTQVSAWARERGRNAAWLEQAVRSGAIVDAEQAIGLDPPAIDVVATAEELPVALQGRQLTRDGQTLTLDTLGAQIRRATPSFWEALAQFVAIPTVAFLLFVLGGIALTLELTTPGLGVPGATGAIMVVAALAGFWLGEVRPLAVALLVGGMLLVGLEQLVSAHGGLAVAGTVLIVLGALFLVDTSRSPGMGVSIVVVGGVALALGTAVLGLVAVASRVREQRPVTGQDALLGKLAEVRQPVAPEGQVFVNGALWSAWTDQGHFGAGELVEVAGVDGLRLYVRRVEDVMIENQ